VSGKYFKVAKRIARITLLDIVLSGLGAAIKILLGSIAAEDFLAETVSLFFYLAWIGIIFSIFDYKRKTPSGESQEEK